MKDTQQQNRRYDIICLTVTTIATAALGAVFLLTGPPEMFPPGGNATPSILEWAPLALTGVATLTYFVLTLTARTAIFHRGGESEEDPEAKRRLTSYTFNIFMLIAAILAVIMIVNLLATLFVSVINSESEGATPAAGNPDSPDSENTLPSSRFRPNAATPNDRSVRMPASPASLGGGDAPIKLEGQAYVRESLGLLDAL